MLLEPFTTKHKKYIKNEIQIFIVIFIIHYLNHRKLNTDYQILILLHLHY